MSGYRPGWQAGSFYQLSRAERAEVVREVNRLFLKKTGISRTLHPSAGKDRELRRTWLRIRDSVIHQREIEEDMELRREDFMDDLPGIVAEDMKTQSWSQAAELLETWYERRPAVMPAYSAPVTKLIKMNWVLQFAESKSVYKEIIDKRIWTDPASQKRFGEILRKSAVGVGQKFGDLSKPVTAVDNDWVNARSIKSREWPLMAALGAFELLVAVSGTVAEKLAQSYVLKVDEVGVYVKDSYDFNGPQFLGLWGHRDSPVNNSDFRKWRNKNHAGGDFLVYSDVKRLRLSTPDSIAVQL